MLALSAATIAALAFMTMSGCGFGDKAKEEPRKVTRSKAKARCAGAECRVRVTCARGRVYVRVGPAPVRIRTSDTLLRTTIVIDFAGSRANSVIRC
jgi:hypothetical protein